MIDYRALVERFGSPLYVYDLDALEAAHQSLQATLPDEFGIYLSLKANPHPLIGATLRAAGGDAEVCSPGELASALAAGFPAGEILYGGPGKTDAEVAAAIAAGGRRFSVESPGDLERVGRHAAAAGTQASCLLRLNAADAASRTSIRMTGTPSQFGIDAETLPDVLDRLLDVDGIRIEGLHFYPLSNAADEESLVAEFRQSIELAASVAALGAFPVRHLDLGGGFGMPYAMPGPPPVYDKLRAELTDALDLFFPAWRDELSVACESGRRLVGGCGELVTSVTNVKTSRGTRYVLVDAGTNTLGGMAGLGRMLPLTVGLSGIEDQPTAPAHLAGPLCTPGDLLGRNVAVPEVAPGDLLRIPNVGAYGASASLVQFLSRPAPAEVFVRGDEVVAATRTEPHRIDIREL